jgi:signal transduction histidine kinase
LASDTPGPGAPRWADRLLDSLVDGLIFVDLTGHVVYWNPRAEELLQWPAAEMIGRRADEMAERVAARASAPDSVLSEFRTSLGALDQDTQVKFKVQSLRPTESHRASAVCDPSATERHSGPALGKGEGVDSVPRLIAARFFPARNNNGQMIGQEILVRDVTEERKADAMKSQLLSTVSHELRTPLASIKGFASTLLRQDVKWDERTQRDFLRIIEEEADRLTEIIDNLLDISQIEAGALRVDKAPTQLRTLIREVVDEMRMRTEAHWFVVDLPSDLPLVMADSRRIRQVLHNLIENAVKYSTGGQVTVACEVEGEQVTTSVSDQGEGIPPEFLDRVFDRFFQVNGGSTRRVGGSGLGLSISRGIIAAHGGRIWAESTVGQGSSFRFTLPIAT